MSYYNEMVMSLPRGDAYKTESPVLTDAERIAIMTAIVYLKEDDDFPGIAKDKATLLALLERTERRS